MAPNRATAHATSANAQPVQAHPAQRTRRARAHGPWPDSDTRRFYDGAAEFRAYLDLFAPAAQALSARENRITVETIEGWTVRHGAPPVQTIGRALAVAIGDDGEEITGVALRPKPDDITRVVRLDIDGGQPQKYVNELRRRYGDNALMVTASHLTSGAISLATLSHTRCKGKDLE